MRVLLILLCLAAPVHGQGVQMAELSQPTARLVRDVTQIAHKTFPNLPSVRLTSQIGAICRGDGDSSTLTRYCTSDNAIYVAADLAQRVEADMAAYLVAHQFGHAVQVRHGIADVALARITRDRAREAEYRGWVTRQVECIAGVLLKRAGARVPALDAEPFTGSHWGRSPMAGGPRVSIGAGERRSWLQTGHRAGDFKVCAVGEFGAELILRAER